MSNSSFPAPTSIQKKCSSIGTTSFIIGIVTFILLCLFIVVNFVYNNYSFYIPTAISSGSIFVFGGSFLIACVGIGLGIAGLAQKNGKKTFGIIGLCMNILILLILCILSILYVVFTAKYGA